MAERPSRWLPQSCLAWWLGGILFFGLLLSAGWWLLRPAPRLTVTLPDGREIALAQVTYGTEHRFMYGKPLAKAVAPFMSAQWRNRHGPWTATYNSAIPTLMFWVRWPDSGGTNQAASTAAVFNEQGNESEPTWVSKSAYFPSGTKVIGWAFANYPRDARAVGLKIFRYDAGPQPRVLAEFRVRNPGPRRHPTWTAPPFPMTERCGELSCTLVNLTAGQATRSRFDMYSPFRANGNLALFQISEAGKPTRAWNVAAIQAVGSTGNICDTKTMSCTPLGEYLLVEFDGALWPVETAWKLKVELSRAADFNASELYTVKAVPLPAVPGTPGRTNLQATVEGLSLLGLRLERAYPAGPFPPGLFQHNAVASLETASAIEGTRVTLVRAVDDRGRPVLHQPGSSGNNTVHRYELRLAPGVTHVDFTFAIHRSRFVEFLSRPVTLTRSLPRSNR